MVTGTVDELIKELESLRISFRTRQEEILADLREAAFLEAEEEVTDYAVRDRVHITTTINSRPQGAAATEQDRTATVTRVTPTRVYVRTDNGFHTWRARTNITLLQRF